MSYPSVRSLCVRSFVHRLALTLCVRPLILGALAHRHNFLRPTRHHHTTSNRENRRARNITAQSRCLKNGCSWPLAFSGQRNRRTKKNRCALSESSKFTRINSGAIECACFNTATVGSAHVRCALATRTRLWCVCVGPCVAMCFLGVRFTNRTHSTQTHTNTNIYIYIFS